jgi:hypothetical protein
VLIPALKLVPSAYKWRIQLRIYRWYRKLIALEHELSGEVTPAQREEVRRRLDEIDEVVHHMRVPASFANQFYTMRQHIDYVRELLKLSRDQGSQPLTGFHGQRSKGSGNNPPS